MAGQRREAQSESMEKVPTIFGPGDFHERYSMRELKEETWQLEAVQRVMTKTGKERHHETQTAR